MVREVGRPKRGGLMNLGRTTGLNVRSHGPFRKPAAARLFFKMGARREPRCLSPSVLTARFLAFRGGVVIWPVISTGSRSRAS